eukprot:7145786-Prymnesium_polylepis.1
MRGSWRTILSHGCWGSWCHKGVPAHTRQQAPFSACAGASGARACARLRVAPPLTCPDWCEFAGRVVSVREPRAKRSRASGARAVVGGL